MILKRIRVNAGAILGINCYIVQDEKTKETMVIDPGGSPDKIIEMLDTIKAKVKYILLTHCHGDHIAGVQELKQKYGGKVLIHMQDEPGLRQPDVNLADYVGLGNVTIEADSRLNDNDLIHVGDIEFKVIHTPGHTKGGICLYQEEQKILFSGDTIFRGTWGRTDLPTSSFEAIIKSITDRIMTLPEDTIIYPGHGKSTMVKEEEPIYLELRAKDY